MHNLHEPRVTGPQNSTVLVTGATGFIGRYLVTALLQAGHCVRAVIRPDRCEDKRLPPGCEQVPIGLSDVDGLADNINSSSAVIYCAGSVRGRGAADFASANIEGVNAMTRALEEAADSAPPLLLLSSLAAEQPQLSSYAQSKYAGEQILLAKPQLPWTILRPPAVYGPGDKELLPLLKMIRRGYVFHPGPRGQRLSLLHVDDLARAIDAWLKTPWQCLGRTFAIDDGTRGGYDWTQIAKAVSSKPARLVQIPRSLLHLAAAANLLLSNLAGYAPMLTPGKVRELVHPRWLCDNHAFSAATGWQPHLDLGRGARQLFASDMAPPAV